MTWLLIWYLVIGWVLLFVKVYIRVPTDVERHPIMALITTAFMSPAWPFILYNQKR